jgi:hypothetical protein
MDIAWSEEKDKILRTTRNVSFQAVREEIAAGRFIGPEANPGYPHIVPFVIDEDNNWFLKTIFPSRKAKKEGRI